MPKQGTFGEPYRQSIEFRREYLRTLFQALRKRPENASPVTHLIIENFQDALCFCQCETLSAGIQMKKPTQDCLCHDEAFIAIRNGIRNLFLKIAVEYEDYDVETQALYSCFRTGLLDTWLHPLRNQLTILNLHVDVEWGIWPFMDVRGLHFPHLKKLMLRHWTIAHDWQIDWVVSHGRTLELLALIDCPIIHALRLSKEITEVN